MFAIYTSSIIIEISIEMDFIQVRVSSCENNRVVKKACKQIQICIHFFKIVFKMFQHAYFLFPISVTTISIFYTFFVFLIVFIRTDLIVVHMRLELSRGCRHLFFTLVHLGYSNGLFKKLTISIGSFPSVLKIPY